MPGREACGRRPSWRRHHALNRQKARIVGLVHHKIKKYYDQSQYVYENKQNRDKMPGERLDIYIKVTRFSQKNMPLSGPLGPFCALGTVFTQRGVDATHMKTSPRRSLLCPVLPAATSLDSLRRGAIIARLGLVFEHF